MATSDLLLMAIYFSVLSICNSSKTLQDWFVVSDEEGKKLSTPIKVNKVASRKIQTLDQTYQKHLCEKYRTKLFSFSACLMLSLSVLFAAKMIQNQTIVPGVDCAIIVALSSIVRSYIIRKQSLSEETQNITSRVCQWCSGMCFALLYAAVGASAHLKDTIQTGAPSFTFALIALIAHASMLVFSSILYNKFTSKFRSAVDQKKITLQHVLVASNCNIGGPATAAAFAGTVREPKRGLIMAATFWGIVGYAVGTSVGVGISYMLTALMKCTSFSITSILIKNGP